jgi:hypothetical protein
VSSVAVEDRAGLAPVEVERLATIIARHSILAEVLRWAAVRSPPATVLEVVTQDEYTHDVVLGWRDGLCLVYDTT